MVGSLYYCTVCNVVVVINESLSMTRDGQANCPICKMRTQMSKIRVRIKV